MKIALVTNSKAPYRKLQLEEIKKQTNVDLTVYYTDRFVNGRLWDVGNIKGVEEIQLKGYKISNNYGFINQGLINIVKNNEVIIIGGYEQPTYILLSLICRVLKKKYVILFDGISPIKINADENKLKYAIKKMVIDNASAVFVNGTVSKRYFNEKFGVNKEKVFNQYLTVDVNYIMKIGANSQEIRNRIRKKYKIEDEKTVVIYSGRLIKRKNVDKIIKAISNLNDKEEYIVLIVGDGIEKQSLIDLSIENNVNCIVTGFIEKQESLFEYYFGGDMFVLPSYDEPWGLVINEAMASGLPVIASNECGCSLDLIKNGINGFEIKVGNIDELSSAISNIRECNKDNSMGLKSIEIIKEWTFYKSAKEFEEMINYLK